MELKKLPKIKVWADEPLNFDKVKAYKGKFVMTEDNKFFAKLFPMEEWDGSAFFHNMILEEMGVTNSQSPAVMKAVPGGGKIEVEMMDGYVEVKLYDKSTIYGRYHPERVDVAKIEAVIREMFELINLPVSVIPDYKA